MATEKPPKRGRKPAVKKSTDVQRLRSGFEKKVFAYLEEKQVKFKYEVDKLPYQVPVKKKVYIPDFTITTNKIIIEAKGKFDRQAREKMLLVVTQHPDRDIRMLFMRNNKISKTLKYTDWCEKHGIKCAVSEHGHIPDAWIEEMGGSVDV